MNPKNKNLTFFEATALITGYGIGGGVLTVPYLTAKTGIIPMIVLLIVGYGISLLIHLMVAEIMILDNESSQLLEAFNKFLFTGKTGFLIWIFFLFSGISFYTTLSAYIAGGGKIFYELIGLPIELGHFLFYVIAGGVVLFGLKVLGMSEKYAIIGIFIIVAIFVIGSFRVPFSISTKIAVDYKDCLSLFGMIMLSFFALYSVPQAVDGLRWNLKLVPKAIILGIAINGLIIITITAITMGVSNTIDEVATITLGKALGTWANYAGNIFIVIAMLTSYWAVSFTLVVIIEERLKWSTRLAWLVSTLPSLLFVFFLTDSFLKLLELTAGSIGLMTAFIIIPLFNAARKKTTVTEPAWTLGVFGNRFFQVIIAIGFIIMGVGALRPWELF